MKTSRLLLITFFLFFLLCSLGFSVARHRAVWNDEGYTQLFNVEKLSYQSIILGKVAEGNNSPLFYIIQKAISAMMHYSIPITYSQWGAGKKEITENALKSQIILRINPVLFMSLAITAIFYYFSKRYSIWSGFYSVLVALSSFMVWAYWAEARPYALLAFLTTIQLLVFLDLANGVDRHRKNWHILTIIHFLLALTSAMAIIQITVISFILWLKLERNWRKYITLFLLPSLICLGYYLRSPKYSFCFIDGPMSLINASISKDRFLIILFFIFYFIVSRLGAGKPLITRTINLLNKDQAKSVGNYLLATMLMLSGYFLFLFTLKLKAKGPGFPVSNRYFISLTPLGIIAATLFSIYLVKAPKSKLGKITVVIGLVVLLVMRGVRTAAFRF